MKYLVTYTNEAGVRVVFYTEWFDVENNFRPDLNMIVFDLVANKYLVNDCWNEIKFDHL